MVQTAEVNWTPLSVVMEAGTPNLDTHPATKASAQAVAVVEDSGKTSTHRVDQSMMVITWLWPPELTGRAPTRSACTWVNLCDGTGIGCRGAVVCVVILAFWQAAHSLHHRPTSAAMPFHTKRPAINHLVALMPGCASE